MTKIAVSLMVLFTSLASTAMAKEPSRKQVEAFWEWNACVDREHYAYQSYREPLKELRDSFVNYDKPVSVEECYSVVVLAQKWIESMQECLPLGHKLLKIETPANVKIEQVNRSIRQTTENLENNIHYAKGFKQELKEICSDRSTLTFTQ
jgi:hypothetical protein